MQRLQHLARARRSEEAELVASQLPWQKLSSQEWASGILPATSWARSMGDKETLGAQDWLVQMQMVKPFQDSVRVRISQAGRLGCDKITFFVESFHCGRQ